ncbi:MAG: DUF255 domain-containing protein [Bacteroidales bacterium]|jgi:thiol:disulfide interchange protein DsbD|nr:DUF255 domain-containing protein [Bacteroidales bacterium]
MNRILAFLSVMLCTALSAQNEVSFSSELLSTNDSIFTIRFSGTMAPSWHVYSVDNAGGPTPAEFVAEKLEGCQLVGSLEPVGESKHVFDDVFGCEVSFFEGKCAFEQKIKVIADSYTIAGYMVYGACNNETCLPPTNVEFSYTGALVSNNETIDADTTSATGTHSLLWIFLSCLLGGFVALLTPCVWPMIPLTVSYFLKHSTSRSRAIRDASLYGLSIVVIYVALGLIITLVSGRPDALNAMSTNAVFNIFFTLLLIMFGLSLLGAFELTLPASWSNAVDRKSEAVGGVLGIFLMAFMLALVSFSCTGPIIGFLLVELSTVGSIVAPTIGMLGFSVALALPFTLFAMFPSLMNKIPRSGSWMMTVKTTLGFIEILFAFKFFSVADIAYGWGLLPRETFLSLWIALAVAYALCMWGIIKMPHDAGSNVSIGRLMTGIVAFAFAIYLVPGLWGAPLNAVSAFAPPIETQDFVIGANAYNGVDTHKNAIKYDDLEQAKQAAKTENKKLLIDFTGYGCVNCRKMEQTVLSNIDVKQLINDNFIRVTLYVDDKHKLTEKEEVMENGKTVTLRTIGDKWSLLQRQLSGVNAQPFFVIMNPVSEEVVATSAFTEDVATFVAFLNS